MEHLHVGEVPRHHRKDRTDRCQLDPVLRLGTGDTARSQQSLGVLRVVVAEPRGLLHLAGCLADDLAHLQRRELGEFWLVLAKHLGQLRHQGNALGDRTPPPPQELLVSRAQRPLDLVGRHLLEPRELLARRGIARNQCHRGVPPFSSPSHKCLHSCEYAQCSPNHGFTI